MFVLTLWSCRKIRLVSKSMTSQPEEQTIAIHIFRNISIFKGNQSDIDSWSVNRI